MRLPPPPASPRQKKSIGTRCETSLHRELKFSYAGVGRTEVDVAGFVADGVNAKGEIIEIQTGSFGPLKLKAKELAAQGKLRIIHPIIISKYIEVFDSDGKRQYRRKSPRRGSPWDLFNALIYAPELPLIRGLTIELVLADVSEQRVRDGKGSWRRKGISIRDRQLIAVHERIRLKKAADYLRFIPFSRGEQFTSANLGEKAGISADMARKVLYVLSRTGVVEKTGKQRNLYLYRAIL
ncbi:MAG: hypothetical protein FWC24_07400 [Treponema sp.]|nr:hypothetical protein [Treponema sp.]